MSGRYYIVQDGERFYAATEKAARRLAKTLADATGKAVHGFQKTAARKARQVTARRNPTTLQTMAKAKGVKYQVTAISPPPKRARLVTYADSDKDLAQIRKLLGAQGYSLITAKPAGWKKNPRKATKRRVRRA